MLHCLRGNTYQCVKKFIYTENTENKFLNNILINFHSVQGFQLKCSKDFVISLELRKNPDLISSLGQLRLRQKVEGSRFRR